jgi:hypothetical protein
MKSKHKARNSQFRFAISAEAYGTFNKKEKFIPPIIKKS